MAAKQSAGVLVQYIAVRGDLWRTQKWPIGALIAQGCHATTAIVHTFMDDPNVREYLADVDRMHKVVLEASTLITCAIGSIYVQPEIIYGPTTPGNAASFSMRSPGAVHILRMLMGADWSL